MSYTITIYDGHDRANEETFTMPMEAEGAHIVATYAADEACRRANHPIGGEHAPDADAIARWLRAGVGSVVWHHDSNGFTRLDIERVR